MTEAERRELDAVAYALGEYGKATNQKGWRILPNRVLALAAVDLMWEWERIEWERD